MLSSDSRVSLSYLPFPEATNSWSAVMNGFLTKIHGRCNLPAGYFLITVPENATFSNDEAPSKNPFNVTPYRRPSISVSASYNTPQAFAAVLQAIFAALTLYHAYGHQIDRFGYAAFGLTVVPYAIMSLLNLIANLVCPTYPAMYLVSNKALRELQTKSPAMELEIDSVVGTLSDASDKDIQRRLLDPIAYSRRHGTDLGNLKFRRQRILFQALTLFIVYGTMLGINGGLSKFNPQASTTLERWFTICWLGFGWVTGFLMALEADNWESRQVLNIGPEKSYFNDHKDVFPYVLILCLISTVATIGGFVVVGKMIFSYGVCNIV